MENFEKNPIHEEMLPKPPLARLGGTHLERTLYYSDAAQKKINDSHFDKPINEAFDSKSHSKEDVVSRKELNKRLIGQYADTINRLKERLENEPDQFRREVLENEIIDQQAEFEEFLGKFSPKELKEYLESEEENMSN